MTYRIPHFFFSNNKPTGVNYTSSVLSSVVYHDGAEYPYLPGLPFYNGQALDNLPNLRFVGDCTDRFNRVAQGHEQNLIDWNERFILLSNNYNEKNIDIVLTWVFELSMALGIGGLLQVGYDWITGQLGEAAVIAAQQAEADRVIASLVRPGPQGSSDYIYLKKTLDDAKFRLNEDIKRAETLWAKAKHICETIRLSYGPSSQTNTRIRWATGWGPEAPFGNGAEWRARNSDLLIKLQQYAEELFTLTGNKYWWRTDGFSPNSIIGRTLTQIEALTGEIRYGTEMANQAFASLKAKISKIVKDSKKVKNLSWSARLIAGLPELIKLVFASIAKLLSVLSIIGLIALIAYATYDLLDKLSAVCSESATTLENINKEKDEFYKNYIKSVESLLQDGCCDIKPCYPPICPNGQKHCPDAEGNCPDCPSGSGSGSNTLGVGLQLLLEIDGGSITKYIPVTLVGDGNGSGGGGGSGGGTTTDHKPLCGFVSVESRRCPPNVDCAEMSVHFGELYQKYINDEIQADPSFKDPRTKTWLRGAETEHPPYTNIPNPKTACNDIPFVFDFGPQCSTYAPLYDAVAAAVSSLIPTSDTVSRTQLDAIREQDLGRRSRGAID